MALLLTFLLSVVTSMIIIRVIAVALSMTGLSDDIARFQALSAFSGAGFTTTEAESLLQHPARRRIIATAIRLGSAGIVAVLASAVGSTFQAVDDERLLARAAFTGAALIALALIARSRAADRILTRLITALLSRYSDLELQDYTALLRLSDGFGIVELTARESDWFCRRSLAELQLQQEGTTVLGIQRPGVGYIAVPTGETVILPGDLLVLYGSREGLIGLRGRHRGREGDLEHQAQRAREQERLRRQRELERQSVLAEEREGTP